MFKKFFSVILIALIIIPSFHAFAITKVENYAPSSQDILMSTINKFDLPFNDNINLELTKTEMINGSQIVSSFSKSFSNDKDSFILNRSNENKRKFSYNRQYVKTTEETIKQDSINQENSVFQHPKLDITESNAIHIVIFILIFIIIVAVSVVYLARKR